MSTTARICDKWDIELPEPGDKPWFLDWALKSPQQVGLHLTAGWLVLRAVGHSSAGPQIESVHEFFGGLGGSGSHG